MKRYITILGILLKLNLRKSSLYGFKGCPVKVIGKRIKQARTYIGVSQAVFGEMAGLENREANVKMSQYESQGIDPKYGFVLRLASAAKLPEFFFYIESDELARSLLEAISDGKDWIYSPQ